MKTALDPRLRVPALAGRAARQATQRARPVLDARRLLQLAARTRWRPEPHVRRRRRSDCRHRPRTTAAELARTPQDRELTSRDPSYEIPNRLEQMEQTVASGDALDMLLATNMISVGIDIDRLGLMVVPASRRRPPSTSRPPAASDASPGLVVTIYNWAGPATCRTTSASGAITRRSTATSRRRRVTPFPPGPGTVGSRRSLWRS